MTLMVKNTADVRQIRRLTVLKLQSLSRQCCLLHHRRLYTRSAVPSVTITALDTIINNTAEGNHKWLTSVNMVNTVRSLCHCETVWTEQSAR